MFISSIFQDKFWGERGKAWLDAQGGISETLPNSLPPAQDKIYEPGGTKSLFPTPKSVRFFFPKKIDYDGEKLSTESCCFLGQTLYAHKNTKSQHFALLPGVSASHRALSILIPEGKSCFLGEGSGFFQL